MSDRYRDFYIPATYHDEPSPHQQALGQVCEENNGVPIEAGDFYREIFPADTIEAPLPREMRWKDMPDGHRGNPLVQVEQSRWLHEGEKPPAWAKGLTVREGRRYTRNTMHPMYSDYAWVDKWRSLQDWKHVYTSGLTYLGNRRTLANAVAMHALVFDLDFTTVDCIHYLIGRRWADGLYPYPNYVVLSGTGMHLYYLFAEPVPLYHGRYGQKVKGQLNQLKRVLTRRLWNAYTVGRAHGDVPQMQGINQTFRMVGSYTKALTADNDHFLVTAYKFPCQHEYEVEYLYKWASDIPPQDRYKGSSVFGLDHWKEKAPDWYQRRIIEGDKSVKYWTMSRGLYDWWKRKVTAPHGGATYGHRYHCLFCLAVYGIKCGIDREEVEKDMRELLPFLSGIRPDDPITESDVEDAMRAYDPRYHTYPVRAMEYLSAIDMRTDRSRRNGRSQADHLRIARAIRDIQNPDGWRDGNGRPRGSSKQRTAIQAWVADHPDGKPKQCIEDTGISKNTVYRWWKSAQEGPRDMAGGKSTS